MMKLGAPAVAPTINAMAQQQQNPEVQV